MLLGIADTVEPLSPAFSTLKVGGFHLIFDASGSPGGARARLAMQAKCARSLPAFLPFSAASPPDLERATPWVLDNDAKLTEMLQNVAGSGQFTLALTAPPVQGPAPLRHRAHILKIRRSVRSALSTLPIVSTISRGPLQGPVFDLLIRRNAETALGEQISQVLAHLLPSDWSGVLVGPLAANAFCQLDTDT